jgi:solute carrier family 25 folate transporter 32
MTQAGSTPPSPGTGEYASSTAFAQGTADLRGSQGVPITALETFCMRRSDSSFNALAGATGGFASGVVTCPLDVIKTKLQAQGGFRKQGTVASGNGAVYNGMLGTARVIWREEGLRGMYRGLGPIILGYLPTWAVWFTVYGKSKAFFSQSQGSHSPIPVFWNPADLY